jgi:hypothetical protein
VGFPGRNQINLWLVRHKLINFGIDENYEKKITCHAKNWKKIKKKI